jgi:hypothetical protein
MLGSVPQVKIKPNLYYDRRPVNQSLLVSGLYLGPAIAFYFSFIIFCRLPVCWCWVPSQTKGRICALQLLLSFTNAVFLWSEFRRTRKHILISQNSDSPNLERQVPIFIHSGKKLAQFYLQISVWGPFSSLLVKVKVKIVLRPTVSRPVSLYQTIIWDLRPVFVSHPWILSSDSCLSFSLLCGPLSDEKSGLSFFQSENIVVSPLTVRTWVFRYVCLTYKLVYIYIYKTFKKIYVSPGSVQEIYAVLIADHATKAMPYCYSISLTTSRHWPLSKHF